MKPVTRQQSPEKNMISEMSCSQGVHCKSEQHQLFLYVLHFVRFLLEIIDLIEKDIDVEGIFRRSGSVAKLKELRVRNCQHFAGVHLCNKDIFEPYSRI